MSGIEPMSASEICYSYSSVLEDSVRDRLWGERDRLRGQVNAILESHGLLEGWENHVSSCHWAEFIEQQFSDMPKAREALISRFTEIDHLTKEWQDFYYGLKRIVKEEKLKGSEE